jgi:hypothetical protein|tara:strand:+ start:8875 stop:9129 length:255 start_codon:yes stop_codon:yes gene_type:complete
MNFRRLFTSEIGKNIISIIFGLGIATLFRKVCNEKNCIRFNGPIITDIEDKTFKHGEKCYKYSAQSDKCDSTKRVVEVMSTSVE